GVADSVGMVPIGMSQAHNVTLLNLTFDNVDYGFNGSPQALLAQDNTDVSTTSLRRGFGTVGSDAVILGNTARNATRDQLFRIQPNRANIQYNHFSNPGRSEDPRDSDNGVIRFDTGQYGYVANNVIEDGQVTLGPLAFANQA